MPSNALIIWQRDRAEKLNYIEDVHQRNGGVQRGRRFTTEQANHIYAVVLSGEFQGFCRDLHDECSDFVANVVANAVVKDLTRDALVQKRGLDKGNADYTNIKEDYARLGIRLWDEVKQQYVHGETWRSRLAH